MIELVVLGSGSRGNCTLVRSDTFALLIDAGFSARQIARRLRSVGQDPDRIDAILLTHEHGDHAAGLRIFTKQFPTPVIANELTRAALGLEESAQRRDSVFVTGESFLAGPFAVLPFPVPHDASDPVGFVLEDRGRRIGYATDLGHVTDEITEALGDCDALVFEANHDREMLRDGPYPARTKQRVASELGHLSNEHAAAELPRIISERTRAVLLGHLSATNNDPALACATVASSLRSLGYDRPEIRATTQSEPSPPVFV